MIQFLFVLALELTSKQFTTLRNFRPIIAPNVFRSAALDQLSQTEAQILYESLRSGIVLDLRNQDEMEKSQSKATEGSQWFYDQLQDSNRLTRIHLPILQNVDEFWDVTISHMPLWDRFAATAQTIVQAGALDARRLVIWNPKDCLDCIGVCFFFFLKLVLYSITFSTMLV